MTNIRLNSCEVVMNINFLPDHNHTAGKQIRRLLYQVALFLWNMQSILFLST